MGCFKSNFIKHKYSNNDLQNPLSNMNINNPFEEIEFAKDLEAEIFRLNINSCKFKEIIVFKDFEVENGVLGLDRDCYLSIIKYLDSSILRKV
jgi:hypothetical protein